MYLKDNYLFRSYLARSTYRNDLLILLEWYTIRGGTNCLKSNVNKRDQIWQHDLKHQSKKLYQICLSRFQPIWCTLVKLRPIGRSTKSYELQWRKYGCFSELEYVSITQHSGDDVRRRRQVSSPAARGPPPSTRPSPYKAGSGRRDFPEGSAADATHRVKTRYNVQPTKPSGMIVGMT